MLSNDSIALLKWFEKHDQWMTAEEIEKGCKTFDARNLKTLKTQKMVDTQLNLDGGNWTQYRINDAGKSYLQNIRAQRLPEIREWINTVIPIITFLAGLSLSDPIKAFFRWLFSLWN